MYSYKQTLIVVDSMCCLKKKKKAAFAPRLCGHFCCPFQTPRGFPVANQSSATESNAKNKRPTLASDKGYDRLIDSLKRRLKAKREEEVKLRSGLTKCTQQRIEIEKS